MKSSLPVKLISLALILAVLAYFGMQAYQYFHDPFSTTLAYATTLEDTISANGWLARDEEVCPSGSGALNLLHTEGEKVGKGQALAVSYPSEDALQKVKELNAAQMQLQQLQFAQTFYLDANAALKLDSSINQEMLTLRGQLGRSDYAAAETAAATLKSQILKRDYSAASQEEIITRIQQTQAQVDSLTAALTGAQEITAKQAGIYSAVCDGYESVLTPEALTDMTPSALSHIKASGTFSNVGKLIYSNVWYYAAAISDADAARLTVGGQTTLRFAKGLDLDMTVTIKSIGPEENGQCVAVFSCDKYLSQTTLLRHQAAQMILKSYAGLHIPANALRVNEEGHSGVYCLVGKTAVFKPANVIYQGEGFCLVKAPDGVSDADLLRPGDQVIASAAALTDGQVIR